MTVNTTCIYISNGFLGSFWITHDISEVSLSHLQAEASVLTPTLYGL